MATERKYKTFKDFYPFYLTEHQDPICQELHFTGTATLLIILFIAILIQKWALLGLIPLVGYGFAWVGHFFFEKNKPASFKRPLYSFMGDWVMYKDMWTGKIKF